jgi:hypothetical protein
VVLEPDQPGRKQPGAAYFLNCDAAQAAIRTMLDVCARRCDPRVVGGLFDSENCSSSLPPKRVKKWFSGMVSEVSWWSRGGVAFLGATSWRKNF